MNGLTLDDILSGDAEAVTIAVHVKRPADGKHRTRNASTSFSKLSTSAAHSIKN